MLHTNLTWGMVYDLLRPIVFVVFLVYISYLMVNFAAGKGWILNDTNNVNNNDNEDGVNNDRIKYTKRVG